MKTRSLYITRPAISTKNVAKVLEICSDFDELMGAVFRPIPYSIGGLLLPAEYGVYVGASQGLPGNKLACQSSIVSILA